MINAYCALSDQPWAITEGALDQIVEIAARENLSPEAVAAKIGRPLTNTRTVENRDGVAVLPVTGPIFPRANLFTEVSGATSTQVLATDFTAALNDPAIKAIILNFDSPGGAVAGINEFSQMVYDARGKKPIVSYVGAQAASGGYWIASAADQVVIDPTAILGSIGTVVSMRDTSARDAKDGVKRHEIVSSQSPLKLAGPDTDAGRVHIQGILDSLADTFIGAVARNRNVSTETVLSDFGRGGQLVGEAAVSAGMADRLGSFEGVVAELSQSGTPGWSMPKSQNNKLGGTAARNPHQGVHQMNEKEAAELKAAEEKKAAEAKAAADKTASDNKAAADAKAAADTAVAAERTRIAAIVALPEAKGREDLARTIALTTDMSAEAAQKLLAAAPVAGSPAIPNPLAAAMQGVANPKVGTGTGSEPQNDDQAEVAAIVSVMKSLKGVK
jgi:signal peptide peptidase SppA